MDLSNNHYGDAMRIKINGYELAGFELNRFVGNVLCNDYPKGLRARMKKIIAKHVRYAKSIGEPVPYQLSFDLIYKGHEYWFLNLPLEGGFIDD